MKLMMDHFCYYFLTMDVEVLGTESSKNVQMRAMLGVTNVPGGLGLEIDFCRRLSCLMMNLVIEMK